MDRKPAHACGRRLIEYHDFGPTPGSFLEDVYAGLSVSRKTLPPKYFYDARGSQLFEAICDLPEYYLTRTELAMLEAAGPDMAARIGRDAAIVEYGSGSGRKTAVLLAAVRPAAYVAIDIAADQLRSAAAALAASFPDVRVLALCADYTRALDLSKLETLAAARRVIFFPGSTIGNLTPDESLAFLRNARAVAGPCGAMLVGVDLKKDTALLHAAYNDAQGVTAAFNLNLLHRINRELHGDFDLSGYEHRAHYDPAAGRIEMHLVSRRAQHVTVAGKQFSFAARESICTEYSYKYSVEEFQALAREAGFEPAHSWVDPGRLFSMHYLTVPA
jgi:dimethylhistidine N-methyltransferase